MLPKGKTPDDIVYEIILKTIDETRDWDPDKGPLEPWLRDQVKSVLDALAKSVDNRRLVSISDENEKESNTTRQEHLVYNIPSSALSPEEQLIQQESEAEADADAKIGILLDIVSGKPDLSEIIEAVIYEDCEPKPRFLAAKLGLPTSEINNRLKRLRRYAGKVNSE